MKYTDIELEYHGTLALLVARNGLYRYFAKQNDDQKAKLLSTDGSKAPCL